MQQELTRFSGEVASNLKTLSDDVAAEAAARSDLERQVQALAGALESGQGSSTQSHDDLQQVLDARLSEFSAAAKRASRRDEQPPRARCRRSQRRDLRSRRGRRPADHRQVEFRQDTLESEVRTLDGSLRKFDEHAGQMVEHINQVTSAIDGRLERVQADALGSLDERIEPIVLRIDDVSAAAARQQAEVANLIGDRVDSSEVRINERMLGLENRMNEEIGQRVADIDAHVGRIGVGLDDAVIMLNDRIAKADQKFTDVETTSPAIRGEMAETSTQKRSTR